MRAAVRSRVRIGAGRWRGRLLEVPAAARPTSSRAREALFDILSARLAGARVLDLYAGSGAIGLEAISRGAATAVLVDRAAGPLSGNVERLGRPPEVRVVESGAEEAVRSLLTKGDRFDMVFSDPPYGGSERISADLSALLAPSGVFVLQLDRGAPPAELPNLRLSDLREYGRNRFAFYAPSAPPDPSRGGPPR